ncbi:MAG: hypothetical protein IT430_09085 [Phycisphaerales bacterium]|nr:hypothetical protein [Phycisphaerales bacterium]
MRKRLRSTIKWSGTVLTVLLLVVWVGSAWWACTLFLPTSLLASVMSGQIYVEWREPVSVHWSQVQWVGPYRASTQFAWWFARQTFSTPGGSITTSTSVPLWSLVCLSALPTTWIWYRDRRRAPGLCAKCGYDLRGADHAVCPECGAAAPKALKAES